MDAAQVQAAAARQAMLEAWERVTTQYPRLFPHWQWVTWAWQ
jgi:hypothetical protein